MGGVFSALDDGSLLQKTSVTMHQQDPFNCLTKEVWSSEKTYWCCENEELGCPPPDCTSPPEVGHGRALHLMWNYDSKSMTCKPFRWGGMGDTYTNRYDSEEQCVQECHPRSTYDGTVGCLDKLAPPKQPDRSDRKCNGKKVKIIGPRSYGGCQTCTCRGGFWDCEGVARIRKEIFNVNDDEFSVFAEAVNTLKSSGEWDKIVQLHGIVEREAHRSNKFLHWHRKYLFDLETMIQAAANSCDVTLPYWNWGYDMGEEGARVQHVWGPKRYGALVGKEDQICGSPGNPFEFCGCAPDEQCPPFNKDRCPPTGGVRVIDGHFGAGSAFDLNPVVGDPNYTMPFPPWPAPMSLAEAAANADRRPFGAIHRCWTGGPVNTQSLTGLYSAQEAFFDATSSSVAEEFPLHPGTVNPMSGRTHQQCNSLQLPLLVPENCCPLGRTCEVGELPETCCLAGVPFCATADGPCTPPGCSLCAEQCPCNGETDCPCWTCNGEIPCDNQGNCGLVDGVNCSSLATIGFVTFVETMWHNSQHCAIGGFMCGFSSPYDPIFWAHHAFVDQIWFDWQQTHLTQEEHDWTDSAGDFTLPWNVCGPGPPSGDATIPASDVENSRHMFGGRGKVSYVERNETLHCSASDFNKVQCCAKVLSRTHTWKQVSRLATSQAPAKDVCSPINAGAASSTQLWLHSLADAGCMSKEQADADYVADMEFLTHLNNHTNVVLKPDASACEKSLCLPLDQFFKKCEEKGNGVC